MEDELAKDLEEHNIDNTVVRIKSINFRPTLDSTSFMTFGKAYDQMRSPNQDSILV